MFRRDNLEISWIPVGRSGNRVRDARQEGFALKNEVVADTLPSLPFDLLSPAVALQVEGLPSIHGASPEAELIELLRAAAEIEHGLMAQYLYAAYSSKNASLARTVRQIAVEEMGHLVTVQNLLLAAGERPYLGRYDRSPNDFDPFPFHLEPISRGAIAKFAACEMPDPADADPEQIAHLPAILKDARTAAGSLTPHRIGLLYMKIYWLLRANDTPLADPSQEPWPGYPVAAVAEQFPGRHVAQYPLPNVSGLQARAKHWQENDPEVLVLHIGNRAEALAAVTRISAQGEGFAGETDAHFDRFVAAYVEAGGGSIAKEVATDPWYAGGLVDGPPGSEITDPISVEFARLSDIVYSILLFAIAISLDPGSGVGEPRQGVIADFCIGLMKEVLKPLARDLPRLSISGAGSPSLALPLTMPDADTESASAMLLRCKNLIEEGRALATSLAMQAAVPGPLKEAAKAVQSYLESRGGDVQIP